MITVTAIKCPNCNAEITEATQSGINFCSYCGAKIMITNENEHIHRYIDEARMRELDMIEDEKKRKEELAIAEKQRLAEQERLEKEQTKKIYSAMLIAAVVGLLMCAIGQHIEAFLGIGILLLVTDFLIFRLYNNKQKKLAGLVFLPDVNNASDAFHCRQNLNQVDLIIYEW